MVLAFILYTCASLACAGFNEKKHEPVTLTIIKTEAGNLHQDQSQGLWSGQAIQFEETPENTDNGNITAAEGQEASTSAENPEANNTGSSTPVNETGTEASGNNSAPADPEPADPEPADTEPASTQEGNSSATESTENNTINNSCGDNRSSTHNSGSM